MISAQTPRPGEIFLDHVAWFLPAMDVGAAVLAALGFTLTPFTRQMNQSEAGPVPAGMANRCAMLEAGYLEFLTAVADTPLAAQFRRQVDRYTGLHLLAFTEADPAATHRRLRAAGFEPNPPVHLRRSVELADGRRVEAAFTVLRLPPGAMPEGRIQLLAHHTPEHIWEPRWTAHDNGFAGLEAALVAVDDPASAAERFARFLDRPATRLSDGRRVLTLDRGRIVLAPAAWTARHVAPLPTAAPVIAAVALGAPTPVAAGQALAAGGATSKGACWQLPSALGGVVTVTPVGHAPAWAV